MLVVCFTSAIGMRNCNKRAMDKVCEKWRCSADLLNSNIWCNFFNIWPTSRPRKQKCVIGLAIYFGEIMARITATPRDCILIHVILYKKLWQYGYSEHSQYLLYAIRKTVLVGNTFSIAAYRLIPRKSSPGITEAMLLVSD